MPPPSPASSAESAIPPQPDHFYPSPFIRPDWRDPNDPESCIWPDEDPAASRGIPVFKPTWDDFKDFEGYVTAIAPWGQRSGIVKVIPPKEWIDSLPSVAPQLADIRLRNPIAQEMIGSAGLFRQSNIERRKTYSVREWVEMCDKEESRTPSPSATLKKERSEKKESQKKRKRRRVQETDVEDEDAREEKEVERGVELLPDGHQQAPPTPDSLPDPATTDTPIVWSGATNEDLTADEKFLSSFDPRRSWLPPDTKPEDYTPEVCAQLERSFWRSIGNLGSPALYGADMKGSLFTDETTSWNVSKLPNPLSRLLGITNRKLPGVNTPYLYFGMWRAAFAWHVEDMDLYSINYIHFGAPKLWWAIPSEKAKAFERTMKGYFPADAKTCSQFLRHKSFLVSPTVLANSSCRPNVLVQHQGEFVITFPQGYHAGINLGFNCAESVNFALQGWEDVVKKADWCKCEADSVKLDIDALREEAREIQAKQAKTVGPRDTKVPKKRKIAEGVAEEEPKSAKRIKRQHSASIPNPIAVKATRPPTPPPTKACILCPSSDEDTLLRVHDVPAFMRNISGVQAWAHENCAAIIPETWVDILDGEKWVFGVDAIEKARWDLKCAACTKSTLKNFGAKIQCTRGKCPRAFHVTCATEKSEVFYREIGEVEKEVVLADAETDGCADQHGHETYGGDEALANGEMSLADRLMPNIVELPTRINEAAIVEAKALTPILKVIKTIKKPIIELLCSTHNPHMRVLAKQRKDEARKKNVLALKEGDRIRIRLSSGVFEVSLLKVDEANEKVEVIWDDQSRREIKWGSIHWAAVSEEVLAASKAKQEAKEEEALEAKLRQYQETLRLAKKHRPILPVPPTSADATAASHPHVQTAPRRSDPAVSATASSELESFTPISSIVHPASDCGPPAPSTASNDILPEHIPPEPDTAQMLQQSSKPPHEAAASSHIPIYPSYAAYPTGYWATTAYPGYWQHPAFSGHGWYDYYGRWHDGPVPNWAYHTTGGSIASAVPGPPDHANPAHGYQAYCANASTTETKGYLYASGSYPHLSGRDAYPQETEPAGSAGSSKTSVGLQSQNNSTTCASSSPLIKEAKTSLHVTPSDILNNPDLVPLLNSLMKNETMRSTLLRLKESFSDQRAPPTLDSTSVDRKNTDIHN
ncbi:JmjC-domain-containing protein [Calocera viscosa TUFC12733]|uniref:[histone H3]-trimethyl-L-lysine(9) demethylase n=1 Tax=Calocera viscosa (strain TUFC12733) TaxID=1330018 RepID=A0A167Q8J6_CALVF|nr:JmjC-domain-containing protein [Calocera viscosa TUFC12733]